MLTRRRLFATFAAIFAAATLPFRPPRSYGLMDVSRWHREGFFGQKCRVLVDGVDVTNDCVVCDDIEGWADVFCRDKNGRAYLKDREVAKKRVFGRVEVVA